MALNFIVIQGRLVKDVELRYTKTDKAVASFTLAVDRGGQDGCDFIPVTAWEKSAQFVDKYFKKGDMCLVSGKLTQRNYEDSNGNKRTAFEVVAKQIDFCGGKKEDSGEKPRYQQPVFTEADDTEELPF